MVISGDFQCVLWVDSQFQFRKGQERIECIPYTTV